MAISRLKETGKLAAGVVGGAAGAYLLDPHNGKRRRAVARDRAAAFFRHRYREAADGARTAATLARDNVVGVAHEARKAAEPERPAPNDQELAQRVMTEIFRPADVPKGSVNVNAEAGIIYLRGEVKRPEEIEELVERASKVDGVRAVENLLHLPGTPARTKQETEPETRRRVEAARPG